VRHLPAFLSKPFFPSFPSFLPFGFFLFFVVPSSWLTSRDCSRPLCPGLLPALLGTFEGARRRFSMSRDVAVFAALNLLFHSFSSLFFFAYPLIRFFFWDSSLAQERTGAPREPPRQEALFSLFPTRLSLDSCLTRPRRRARSPRPVLSSFFFPPSPRG